MRLESAVAADVLERILSAYGFTMQKDLSEKLGIAKSNVASWLQRGQVPGNVIVQCALDTGSDVNWLVMGELAKANSMPSEPSIKGKPLYDEIMSNGGKPVLRRILDAYGFSMQKQLCELLGLSSGTVSTWVRRNYFPGDVVVTCALDTGVSLQWLATGKNAALEAEITEEKQHVCRVEKFNIGDGTLIKDGYWYCDLRLINPSSGYINAIEKNTSIWLVDFNKNNLSNGKWLINIDSVHDVYDVQRIPGNRVKLVNDGVSFDCEVNSLDCKGQVVTTISKS